MSNFIKQCKGLDSDKVSVADDVMFYASIKLDGIYIQIHKSGSNVTFFTSSGKEFWCNHASDFSKLDFDFKIEAEYIIKNGKLGLRSYADNEIKKAVKDNSFLLTGSFVIHDIIDLDLNFGNRLKTLKLFNDFNVSENTLINFSDAKDLLKSVSKDGFEGIFLKKSTHSYLPGKKSKDALKLKKKYTADLVVTAIDGKYVTCKDDNDIFINKLICRDANLIEVGFIIEVEYEQLLHTYQVPVYKCIRWDKMS